MLQDRMYREFFKVINKKNKKAYGDSISKKLLINKKYEKLLESILKGDSKWKIKTKKW